MPILKAGMHIRHDAVNSTRYNSVGVVLYIDRCGNAATDHKPRIVVCWLSGGDLNRGFTAMVEYKSLWLENNVEVLAQPVTNVAVPASEYRKQFDQAAASIAKGPYLVNVVGSGGEPRKEHQSLSLAKEEARRLSKPGRKVQVLAVVATVQQKAVTTYEEEWS